MMSKNTGKGKRSRTRRLSLGRRLAFTLILLAGLLLFLELASLGAFLLVYRSGFSWSAMSQERMARLGEAKEERVTSDAAAAHMILSRDLVLHPFVGYTKPPGKSVWPGSDRKVTPSGLDDSPFVRRSDDKLIICITGGSVAQIFGQTGAQSLAALLGRASQFAGKKIVFIRTGAPAYRQPQQFFTLCYVLALGGLPDIVINIDGLNDLCVLFSRPWKGISLYYPGEWASRARGMPPRDIRLVLGKISYYVKLRKLWSRVFERNPLNWFITTNLLWRSGDQLLTTAIARSNTYLRKHAWGESASFVLGPLPDFANPREMYGALAELWRHSSLLMERTCQANGIRYFHFLQPSQYVPGSKELTARERTEAWAPDGLQGVSVSAGYPLLQQAGRELAAQGESFTDLTGMFRDVKETLYYDTVGHFKQKGNDILAQAIGRVILEDLDH